MKPLKHLSALFFLAGILVFVPGYARDSADTANAPAGRREVLTEERRDQTEESRPPRMSFLERSLKWLEDQGILNNGGSTRTRAFTPMVGTVEPGSGLAGGAGYHNSFLQASAAYSYHEYQQYDLQLGHNAGPGSFFIRPLRFTDLFSTPEVPASPSGARRGSIWVVDARYRSLPQMNYYGQGPDSLEENRSDFLLQESSLTGIAGYQWNPHIRISARGGYIAYNIGDGTDPGLPGTARLFTGTTAPGLLQEPDYLMLGPAIVVDFRDQPGNPHSGIAMAASVARYQPRSGDFAFNSFESDFRGFLPLGARSRVLAFRLLSSFDVTSGNNEVPFYVQQTLGGSNTLRGYPEGRFRDNDLAYASAEYRWEIVPAMELALFYDTGAVAGDFSGLGASALKNSYGAGIRFKTRRSFLFRVDYGHSREDNVVLVAFSPSF